MLVEAIRRRALGPKTRAGVTRSVAAGQPRHFDLRRVFLAPVAAQALEAAARNIPKKLEVHAERDPRADRLGFAREDRVVRERFVHHDLVRTVPDPDEAGHDL